MVEEMIVGRESVFDYFSIISLNTPITYGT